MGHVLGNGMIVFVCDSSARDSRKKQNLFKSTDMEIVPYIRENFMHLY